MKKISSFLAVCCCILFANCSSNTHQEVEAPADSRPDVQEEQVAVVEESSNMHNMDSLTKVLIKTTMGDIKIVLYDNTPKHKENFIQLVKNNYYTDVLFHRIIQGFMIQTGDPDSKGAPAGQQLGMGGPGYTIPAEFNAENYHKRGAVAAARNNNPAKASSGSQFYIVDGRKFAENELRQIEMQMGKHFTDAQKAVYMNVGGAPFLDGDYTVFGEVVEGMDVVDKIAAQPKDRFDRPKEDIKIIGVIIVE